MTFDTIYNDDCLPFLHGIPDDSIDCCITSPPYFALRDYGTQGQIGLEDSPEEYIAHLCAVFAQVLRVLKPEGTCWINMGDTYNGYRGNACRSNNETPYAHARHQAARPPLHGLDSKSAKNKDLLGIPWMLAFALRDMGFYLRQDIIWQKPNPVPESVIDRCTKSHEYIFLLTKSARYYFDADSIREPAVSDNRAHRIHHRRIENGTYRTNYCDYTIPQTTTRNKRDVWTVPVRPSKGCHFATFPEELIAPCVLAGCPEGGVILDPFIGTGTTAIVAHRYNRHFIGCEINPEYYAFASHRIREAMAQPSLFPVESFD